MEVHCDPAPQHLSDDINKTKCNKRESRVVDNLYQAQIPTMINPNEIDLENKRFLQMITSRGYKEVITIISHLLDFFLFKLYFFHFGLCFIKSKNSLFLLLFCLLSFYFLYFKILKLSYRLTLSPYFIF